MRRRSECDSDDHDRRIEGEGGGQILRTALALSLATGTPFRIENIRAKPPKPGLLRQHLTAVQAATASAMRRSKATRSDRATLTFTPGAIRARRLPLRGRHGRQRDARAADDPAAADARERRVRRSTLEGGTHNPAAPPFDFLQRVFLPLVNRARPARVEAVLERPGSTRPGGGRVHRHDRSRRRSSRRWTCVDARRHRRAAGFARSSRTCRATSASAKCDGAAAAQLERRLRRASKTVRGVAGPGNVVLIEIEVEHVTEIFTGFGEIGVAPKRWPTGPVEGGRGGIWRRTCRSACHLADQLLPMLALGGGGVFRTMALSQHALTNIDVDPRSPTCGSTVDRRRRGRRSRRRRPDENHDDELTRLRSSASTSRTRSRSSRTSPAAPSARR